MSDALLLDTCAVIWTMQDARMSDKATSKINTACDAGQPVFVSPISAWEIGMLASRGRVAFSMPPEIWFDKLISNENIVLAKLATGMLIQSSFLPGNPPNDPADRIILSTARHMNMTVITRDRLILDYAAAGNVKAVEC